MIFITYRLSVLDSPVPFSYSDHRVGNNSCRRPGFDDGALRRAGGDRL